MKRTTFVKTPPRGTPRRVLDAMNAAITTDPHYGVLPQDDADAQTRRQNRRTGQAERHAGPDPRAPVNVSVNFDLNLTPEQHDRAAKRGLRHGLPDEDEMERKAVQAPMSGSVADSLDRVAKQAFDREGISQEDRDEVAASMFDPDTGSFSITIDPNCTDEGETVTRIVVELLNRARALPARRAALKKASDAFDKDKAWKNIRGVMNNELQVKGGDGGY